jgi:hypothetical protein
MGRQSPRLFHSNETLLRLDGPEMQRRMRACTKTHGTFEGVSSESLPTVGDRDASHELAVARTTECLQSPINQPVLKRDSDAALGQPSTRREFFPVDGNVRAWEGSAAPDVEQPQQSFGISTRTNLRVCTPSGSVRVSVVASY